MSLLTMLVLCNMEMKHFAVNVNHFLQLTLPFVIVWVESRSRAKDSGQLKVQEGTETIQSLGWHPSAPTSIPNRGHPIFPLPATRGWDRDRIPCGSQLGGPC